MVTLFGLGDWWAFFFKFSYKRLSFGATFPGFFRLKGLFSPWGKPGGALCPFLGEGPFFGGKHVKRGPLLGEEKTNFSHFLRGEIYTSPSGGPTHLGGGETPTNEPYFGGGAPPTMV